MAEKRVTIKDISQRLGVSYGIINRALNNKPGVSAKTRERILNAAREMGYRENKVAKSLARATLNLAILVPKAWQSYYSVLVSGIKEELDRLLDYNVRGSFYEINNSFSPSDTVETLRRCVEDGASGIILCDVFPGGLEAVFDDIIESSIPILTIGSYGHIENKCLCSVHIDAYKSGMMAAEMLSLALGGQGSVIAFVGNKDSTEHSGKIQGFSDGAKSYGLNFAGAYETYDDNLVAAQLFENIIRQGEAPEGIYIATATSESIIDLAERESLGCAIVTTDVSPYIAERLRRSTICCSLFQSPAKQGKYAIRAMYEYLADGIIPQRVIKVAPQLVINGNIDDFN